MVDSPLLEMKGISKRYPGVVALDGVDLEVRQGEIRGLIGENGAGKSTLMKILGGVVKRDAGTVRVAGSQVEISSPLEASMMGIEFIHQELSVLDNLDVAANIFLRREPIAGGPLKFLRLIDSRKIYADADAQLRRLGLNFSSRTLLGQLPIAHRQLVEIARALSSGARILIMDEPTSSLTLAETRRLLEIIRELKSQGVSMIYISHHLDEVEEIADRVVALRDGQNAGELERSEISRDRMVQMMVGRSLKDFYIHDRKSFSTEADWFKVEKLRTRRYPQCEVSFGAGRGEVLGIAGLVGAGRSELAATIFGVDGKAAGEIRLDGRPLRIDSPKDAIAEGIYLVPEDRRLAGLVLDFNVRQNVTLPGLARYAAAGLVNTARETAKSVEMIDAIGIKTPSPEMRAGNLSGGNQQKVVLAKWLALDPKVMIFDEPTRGIDIGAKAEIYALIRDLAMKGVTIIVISSEMEEVLGISDRIAVMREGHIDGVLSRDEFSEEAVVRLATGTVPAEAAGQINSGKLR
jgi:ribose transport system ATP-binding protein